MRAYLYKCKFVNLLILHRSVETIWHTASLITSAAYNNEFNRQRNAFTTETGTVSACDWRWSIGEFHMQVCYTVV